MTSLVKLQSSRRALPGGLAASSLAAATRAAAKVGPFVPPPATSAVTPFSVRIPHTQLTDLKGRLKRAGPSANLFPIGRKVPRSIACDCS
jgi:hypothetical protein